MLLSEAKVGCEYIVHTVVGHEPICRRLIEYGFVRDAKVKVVNKSIGGSSLLVQLHRYTLAIKKTQASLIEVGL